MNDFLPKLAMTMAGNQIENWLRTRVLHIPEAEARVIAKRLGVDANAVHVVNEMVVQKILTLVRAHGISTLELEDHPTAQALVAAHLSALPIPESVLHMRGDSTK